MNVEILQFDATHLKVEDLLQFFLTVHSFDFILMLCCHVCFSIFSSSKQCSEMGRPSGSMERKLERGEIERIGERCEMTADAVKVLMADAGKLFGSAASDEVTITRNLLRGSLWFMKELAMESPAQIVHADSRLSSICSEVTCAM